VLLTGKKTTIFPLVEQIGIIQQEVVDLLGAAISKVSN